MGNKKIKIFITINMTSIAASIENMITQNIIHF